MYEVNEITWQEIKQVWEKDLWPNRKDGIHPVQHWTWHMKDDFLGKDKQILETSVPTFFGIKIDNKIVCVNSVFVSNKKDSILYFRSRGLWTDTKYRKQALAKTILLHCMEYAKQNGGDWIWTVPRKSAFSAYASVGFTKKSDWFDEAQFGPNCIASKYL